MCKFRKVQVLEFARLSLQLCLVLRGLVNSGQVNCCAKFGYHIHSIMFYYDMYCTCFIYRLLLLLVTTSGYYVAVKVRSNYTI